MPMNSMSSKALCAILVAAVCAPFVWAGGTDTTQWEADTSDPDRFAGSVTITGDEKERKLAYSFVYDTQIISTNDPQTAILSPMGNECWHADITGDFLQDIAPSVEVVFCERGERAYWSLLDTRGGAVRLPGWVSFTQP